MYIGLTDEQEALRAQLRVYYQELLTPDVRADLSREQGVGPEQALQELHLVPRHDGGLGRMATRAAALERVHLGRQHSHETDRKHPEGDHDLYQGEACGGSLSSFSCSEDQFHAAPWRSYAWTFTPPRGERTAL